MVDNKSKFNITKLNITNTLTRDPRILMLGIGFAITALGALMFGLGAFDAEARCAC